jgi:hypothetical protein
MFIATRAFLATKVLAILRILVPGRLLHGNMQHNKRILLKSEFELAVF